LGVGSSLTPGPYATAGSRSSVLADVDSSMIVELSAVLVSVIAVDATGHCRQGARSASPGSVDRAVRREP
jgi:hypothetical protein